MRVLIVEDSSASRLLISKLLKSLIPSLECVPCNNGYSALAELTSGREFDLVILDLGLPDISGLQLLALINNLGLQCQTITISDEGSQSTLRDSLGAGAVAYLTKPLSKQQLSDCLRANLPFPKEDPKPKILIVDDEKVNIFIMRKLLEKSSFELFEASNGFEALRVLDTQNISVVLMDIRMPYMDGFEASERIKRIRPDLPIIVITAQPIHLIIDNKRSIYMDHILGKPIRSDLLQDALEKCLLKIHHKKRSLFKSQPTSQQKSPERPLLNDSILKFVPKEFLKETFNLKGSMPRGLKTISESSVLDIHIDHISKITDQMSAEQYFNFLNSFFDMIDPIIQSFGGHVLRMTETGIVCSFPLLRKSLATHSLHAAISIQDHITIYNQGRQRAGYPPVHLSIGIASGPLALGLSGSSQRYELVSFGTVFTRASIVNQIARNLGLQIALTPDSLEHIDDLQSLCVRPIGLYPIDGTEAPTPLYEVFVHESPATRNMKLSTLRYLTKEDFLFDQAHLAKMHELFPDDGLWRKILLRTFCLTKPTLPKCTNSFPKMDCGGKYRC